MKQRMISVGKRATKVLTTFRMVLYSLLEDVVIISGEASEIVALVGIAEGY